MRFFAIYASEMLRGGPTLAADDRAFGAWARLATRAAELEDPAERGGVDWGRIRGAGVWPDRQLLASTCTDQAGVAAAMEAGLVVRDGADLLVWGYDSAGQKAVESKRKNGAKGGRPKNQQESESEPVGNRQVGFEKPRPNLNETPLLSSPLLPFPSHGGAGGELAAPSGATPPPQPSGSGTRQAVKTNLAGHPEQPPPPKRRAPPAAQAALVGALSRAMAVPPALSKSLREKASARLSHAVTARIAPDLEAAGDLLVAAWLDAGHANNAWKLCDVTIERPRAPDFEPLPEGV